MGFILEKVRFLNQTLEMGLENEPLKCVLLYAAQNSY